MRKAADGKVPAIRSHHGCLFGIVTPVENKHDRLLRTDIDPPYSASTRQVNLYCERGSNPMFIPLQAANCSAENSLKLAKSFSYFWSPRRRVLFEIPCAEQSAL